MIYAIHAARYGHDSLPAPEYQLAAFGVELTLHQGWLQKNSFLSSTSRKEQLAALDTLNCILLDKDKNAQEKVKELQQTLRARERPQAEGE